MFIAIALGICFQSPLGAEHISLLKELQILGAGLDYKHFVPAELAASVSVPRAVVTRALQFSVFNSRF